MSAYRRTCSGTQFLLLAWVLAWLPLAAMAAKPAPRPAPIQLPGNTLPNFSAFTSRDGLSDEVWATLGFDSDGFVWAGSASSLARFDGYRWAMWPIQGVSGLVRSLERDAEGRLWALFEQGGLAQLRDGEWHVPGGQRGGIDLAVLDGPTGRELWLTHDHGVSRLQRDQWIEDPGNAGITPPVQGLVRTETVRGAPYEWLSSPDTGLWFRPADGSDHRWQPLGDPRVPASLTALWRSFDGPVEELWVVARGQLLRLRGKDEVQSWRSADGSLPSVKLYNLAHTYDADGVRSLWVSSRAGLVRMREGRIDVVTRLHGLPSDVVRSVKVQRTPDGVDVLWVATEEGIARAPLTELPWRTVSQFGAPDLGVFGLMIEPDGRGGERLWVGSYQDGLGLLEDGRWRVFSARDGSLPVQNVRGVWRVHDDQGRPRRLVGANSQGLLEVTDDYRVMPFDFPLNPTSDDGVRAVIERRVDGVNEWWLGTRRSGVFRWRAGEWTAWRELDGRPWGLSALQEYVDAGGRSWLWAGGPRGLALFDGGRWSAVPAAAGLPEDWISSMAVLELDGRTELWLGSLRNGVLRLDIGNPRAPSRIEDARFPAPPDPTVYSVLADPAGRVYICTNNGVQQLVPGADGGYVARSYRRADGLAHDECNAGSQAIDAQQRYWIGTMGGLSMFDPAARDAELVPRPKPLHFTAYRVNDVERRLHGERSIELPPDVRELRLDFSLLSGIREQDNRYRSHLVGYEPSPLGWSERPVRVFTRVPPGEYEFRLEALDHGGTAAPVAALRIRVAPRWFEQAWLQWLIGLGAAAVGVAAIASHERAQRRRQRQLGTEVARRTAELRDANARLTELSYLDQLTGVANRRRLMAVLEEQAGRARDTGSAIGVIAIDVDHFKEYNDRHGHVAGDAALRAVAQAIAAALRPNDLVARYGGEEFVCVVAEAGCDVVERIAERIRLAAEALTPAQLANPQGRVTVSAGAICRVPAPGEQATTLINGADEALYEAKRAGRNRVVVRAAPAAR